MLLLTCGVYMLTMFRIDSFTSSFVVISLSDTLFTSRTLSASSSFTLSHFFFHQLCCKIICIHLQCSLLYFVFCRHSMSTFLCSIKSASSLPLSVIVPIFKVPTLMSEHLSFHTSCCLFTCLLSFSSYFYYI